MKSGESGNVIFYILIAVALLAALSYSVAQSGRSSLKNLSQEKSRLFATEIIEQGNTLATTTSQLRLRGYKDTEISFENDIVTGYENPDCDVDGCKVFSLNGGGVHYLAPKSEWLDPAFSGNAQYGEIYIHGAAHIPEIGLDADDLIVFIPYIRREICLAINERLGIDLSVDGMIPLESNGPFTVNQKFTGTYGSGTGRKVSGDATVSDANILTGKSAGCTQSSGTSGTPTANSYHYYHVLMAR